MIKQVLMPGKSSPTEGIHTVQHIVASLIPTAAVLLLGAYGSQQVKASDMLFRRHLYVYWGTTSHLVPSGYGPQGDEYLLLGTHDGLPGFSGRECQNQGTTQ